MVIFARTAQQRGTFCVYRADFPNTGTVKHLRHLLLFALLSAGLWSCSVNKNNFFSRSYHGTTTHYNFYFNARERMKEASASLADAHEDKYDRILNVFKIADLNKAKGFFADFDEAIKKASIAITRHSITAKGRKDKQLKEHNRWIPECYLVVGQSQYYKHDFWTAIETFQFMSSEYKNDEIRSEAMIWLTRSYLELGKTTDAEYLIDYLKADKNFPLRYKGHFYAVRAHYHLIKKDLPRAAECLQLAASNTRNKNDRARYYFILGQIQQKSDSLQQAFAAYQNVLRLNPSYEMAFNARINRARCFDTGSEGAYTVKRELNKMLKDENNAEFRDQIYFALAGVAKQEKNEPLAMEYLNTSIQVSASNQTQKALSYLELGNIYLKRPEYLPAAAYYDSALTNLTQDYPDYFDIQSRRNSLDRLVTNLKIILSEDSLQRLVSMSASEREAAVKKIIEAEDAEKERLKKEQEAQKRLEEQQIQEERELRSQPRALNQPNSAAGSWYFFNQSAISFGETEFLKRWGNRKLEDNWRRSEKELSADGGEAPAETIDSTKIAAADSIAGLDPQARAAAYLSMLPSSPEAIAESNARITEAYYNCGIIYKEQLSNYKESISSFESLDKRFPENKYKQPSYYNLYRIYLILKDSAKADYYKNYILNNYPESDYARLILNPNFFRDMQRKSEVLEVFYENTYKAYLNRQYAQVIERKQYADESFPANNKLAPKFALLKALAVGRTRSMSDFRFDLEEVIRQFPKDSVSIRAKELLDYIDGKSISKTNLDTAAVDTNNLVDPFAKSAKFVLDNASMHFFVVVYPKGAIDAQGLMEDIRKFNEIDFPELNLTVSNGAMDLSNQYIAVMSFASKDESMGYYRLILSEPGLLDSYDPQLVRYFAISQDNLSELTRTRDMAAYAKFFRERYLE